MKCRGENGIISFTKKFILAPNVFDFSCTFKQMGTNDPEAWFSQRRLLPNGLKINMYSTTPKCTSATLNYTGTQFCDTKRCKNESKLKPHLVDGKNCEIPSYLTLNIKDYWRSQVDPMKTERMQIPFSQPMQNCSLTVVTGTDNSKRNINRMRSYVCHLPNKTRDVNSS